MEDCKSYPVLLFDTRSIQRFIYTGNKLKTNVGASYLVSHIFDYELPPVLEKNDFTTDTQSWKTRLATEKLIHPKQALFAANAGGSAMVLFSVGTPQETLLQIVRDFSSRLLIKAPGLHIGSAHGSIRLDAKHYKDDRSALYEQLKQTQNRVFPEVNLPYTGLTLRCPINSETANRYVAQRPLAGNQHFLSQESFLKIEKAAEANADLAERLGKDSPIVRQFEFPLEIEDLGQVKYEKNYFAIVHIDGNNMGKKFQNHDETQQAFSHFSQQVSAKTWQSFVRLLDSIADEYGHYLENHAAYRLDLGARASGQQKEKPYLPIRPIILGGDDVTFVCAASMALTYTRRFMTYMMDPAIGNATEPDAQQIDCCAGIAILKTTYPFFRGYELAEQLCDAAKKRMRAQDGPSCWLDFLLLHGEQAPTLEEILAQEYTSAAGAPGGLHFGPYRVNNTAAPNQPSAHYHDLDHLFRAVHDLRHGGKDHHGCMAHSKAKELRSALQHGPSAVHQFITQLRHLEQELPDVPAWKNFEDEAHALFIAGETPYVDAIEMMDFLPDASDTKEATADEH